MSNRPTAMPAVWILFPLPALWVWLRRARLRLPPAAATGQRGVLWRVLLALALALAWAAGSAAPADPAGKPAATAADGAAARPAYDAPQPLRVGIFAYRPKDIIRSRYEGLGHYLSAALGGMPVEIIPLTDAELEERVASRSLEFVFTNPTHFIKLRELGQLSGALATLVTRKDHLPMHGIGGVIVRRADRPDIAGLQSLEGKRIAIAGRHYLGTYMAPAYELLRAGVDLGRIHWVETRQPVDQVLSKVLSGEADAGFLRTGVLEDHIGRGLLKPDELVVLNPQHHPGFGEWVSTRLYPEWPFLAAIHVDRRISQRVASALLALRPSDPAALQADIYGFTIPADYSAVEAAMRELRMAPFDGPTEVYWRDVLRQYGGWVVALLGLTAAALALLAILAAQRRDLLRIQARLRHEHAQLQAATARLNYLMASSPVMFFTLRVSGAQTEPTWVGANIEQLLGYPPEAAMQAAWWHDHIHPADRSRVEAQLAQLHRLGHIRQTYRFARADGQYRWFETDVRLLQAPAAPPGQAPLPHGEALGVWRDVTHEHQQQEQLRLGASVFANSYDGIAITDAEHRMLDTNPAFARITGRSPEALRGQPLPSLLAAPPDSPEAVSPWARALRSLQRYAHWAGELPVQAGDGRLLYCAVSISAVALDDGPVTHHVVVLTDITPLKMHQAELDRLAHYDTLTGVPNRRLLLDRLTQAIERAKRGGHWLAVCYLDLDDFKPVNDRLGHAMGDELLVRMTERLQHLLRVHDTLARLGGDEFVLLLTDLAQPEEWRHIVQRLLQAVQEPVTLGNTAVQVSASVGVTVYPDDAADGDTLLRHADQAMYQAKQSGRNRVHRFDQTLDREVQVQREQLTRLQQALAHDELTLHYQPKVDLDSGAVIGAEALIRWQHPEQGLLPPGAFLWHVAGTDVEVQLGEWVIRQAAAQRARWKAEGLPVPEGFCISVNISGHQLLRPGFAHWMQTVLEQYPQIRSGELELEILESAALADTEAAARVMADCRALGLRFALDDFGTGYSSLAYFRTLPVDVIKIDQGFVRDMLEDPDDQGIVQSVVYLAHAFARPVIAEGVETLEHARALVRLGCHLAQGYGVGKPMPAEEWPAWLAQWRQTQPWKSLG